MESLYIKLMYRIFFYIPESCLTKIFSYSVCVEQKTLAEARKVQQIAFPAGPLWSPTVIVLFSTFRSLKVLCVCMFVSHRYSEDISQTTYNISEDLLRIAGRLLGSQHVFTHFSRSGASRITRE